MCTIVFMYYLLWSCVSSFGKRPIGLNALIKYYYYYIMEIKPYLLSKSGSFGLIHLRFFDSEGHVALDRNPGPGYDTLLLRMIPGDLLSAFPHRQFNTLPGLLDSWATLPNSNPNACMPMQGGSLYHFI